ncbi:MAG: recombinase RecA [Planctomycetaceae bacterium]|jgi:KaiC/GvpD/RAD55 family RecA-like ATPase|nr:recombinase RecA [Planctomycetaceae bacterium]MBT6154134.1 recombinase RecA [Planctomycetaceae bacterium]MBT6485813.1 recombinase RecA [Planctomycetaceae bacterium]MBT6497387.1 recombinase RecA [Planctomycetaceae bacterium]
MTDVRQETGIAALDDLLGGGLIPGTLTVVLGATGIGKTQLGVQFARQGLHQEGETGVVFDMTSRGDSQNHAEYARRLFDWEQRAMSATDSVDPMAVWDRELARFDYLHLFRHSGRRVSIGDLEPDDWREWKIELAKKLQVAIAYFYGNLVHGVQRCVIDGLEPTDKASDSFQMHMFDYVYHQILRKESEWVARDLFRVKFREQEPTATAHRYDHKQVGCLLLYTTHEVMLDQLLSRPIETGDVLSNANTIILMGKVRDGTKMGRALHVAKHRGSYCREDIVPFTITENGLLLDSVD